MAATGLLGINPYQKGVAIDIASKPINLAIQLEQKEIAKREALDKYLMDYEKSFNPAGMRKQDQDVFLGKLAQAKQYYLQNRDKILNPAKYGAEAQSTYFNGLRDAQNSIGQSKQAMAQDKLATQHYIAQKDLNAPDGYAEAVELSHLPISDPRYRPLDVTQWKFYKSHDPMEYANKVFSKIPLSEGAPEIKDASRPGYIYYKTTSKISPENYGRVLQDGYNSFETDEGLRKTMINMFADKEKVKDLELKYNTKIPTAKALAGVYTLDLQPIKETTTNPELSAAAKRFADEQKAKRLIDYNRGQVAPVRNLLDDVASIKTLKNKDVNISKGIVLGKDNKPYTGDVPIDGANIPADIFTVLGNYKINISARDRFKLIVKDGRVQGLQTKKGQIIDRGTIEAAQRKYDTEPKGVPGLYPEAQEAEDGVIDLSNFDLSKIKK
jgi:hypothetical protein